MRLAYIPLYSYIRIANTCYMKKLLFSFLAVSALTVSVSLADDPPPIGGSPDPIPVDGGVSLLAAAGVGYGVKRLRASKKKATK